MLDPARARGERENRRSHEIKVGVVDVGLNALAGLKGSAIAMYVFAIMNDR